MQEERTGLRMLQKLQSGCMHVSQFKYMIFLARSSVRTVFVGTTNKKIWWLMLQKTMLGIVPSKRMPAVAASVDAT